MRSRRERELRWYRGLLRLFPAGFRRQWGPEMEALFRHRMDTARGGRWARSRIWGGIVLDAAMGASGEWFAVATKRRRGGRGEMNSIVQDIRHAARGLRGTPGVAIIAIVTLTLGIGATTTTFSVVDGVMLKPLPYGDPGGLVSVWPAANFNVALVREFAEGAPALQSVAGISTWTAVLSSAGDPTEIDVARVSPAYFEILGVRPELGRWLQRGDDLLDRSAVAVLSHALWANRFGSDPEIVGRTIQLSVADHQVHTVVGVMPRGFKPAGDVRAWTPLVDDLALSYVNDSSWFVNHRIARLAAGVTPEQASEQVRTVAERIAPDVPNQFGPEQLAVAGVVGLKNDMLSDTRLALWILLGAVGLVLLIACANVANLLLARGEARRHDLAVRVALGAGRGRIVRLLLMESLVLGLVGGTLGVAAALALTDVVIALAPPDIPRIADVSLNWSVLTFALAVTMAATLMSGLWPAMRASRGKAAGELGGSVRGLAGRSSGMGSRALVVAEISLAVVVTLGSGLMLRSLDRLLSAETGFQPEGVVAFRANPLGTGREGAEDFRQFYGEILAQVEVVPGVQEAGAVQILTGTPNNWSFPTYPEGYVIPESGAMPDVNFRAVTPGYFETLRIPLLRGRTIESADREGAEPVVVVNRAFVDRFWPGEDGLGKTLSVFSTDGEQHRVVGVVGDIRQHALNLPPVAELYVPYMAWSWEMSAWILVRSDNPDRLKAAVRGIVDAVDPAAPVSGVDDLDKVLNQSAAETRFFTILLTVFGLLGMSLGAIGIYGVTAHSVARRRAEFGVRLALGATKSDIVGSAVRTGLGPVVLGAAGGGLLGLVTGRLLESYLYEINPSDPTTFMIVLAALGLVASSALALPAWRASRADPAEILVAG